MMAAYHATECVYEVDADWVDRTRYVYKAGPISVLTEVLAPLAEAQPKVQKALDFFRKNGQAAPAAEADPSATCAPSADAVREAAQAGPQPVPNPVLYKHWNAIRADGISASQFIAFLQPLADLDGITVSYTYSGEDCKEHVYTRRREDEAAGAAAQPRANPLSEAIRKGKLSKEKALTFALNEEGRVWIESNFLDLK